MCWDEIWDVIGPMLHGALDSGTTVWSEDQRRGGRRREAGVVGGLPRAVPAEVWPLQQVIDSRAEVRIEGLDELVSDGQADPRTESALALSVLGGAPAEVRAVGWTVRSLARTEA